MKSCPPLAIALMALVLLAGCIEGARVKGALDPAFLGPEKDPDAQIDVDPDAPIPDDADAPDPTGGDVEAGGDVTVVTDADVGPEADGDSGIADDVDVEPPPCVPGVDDCPPCTEDNECGVADDGNLCNGTFVCDGGTCVADDAVVECDQDGTGGCADAACDPATGACVLQPRPNGTLCTDANACTTGDGCLDGACVGGPPRFCDDGNPCTTDKCSGGTCVFQKTGGSCDDGNACTVDDACAAGACKGGANQCTCASDADCEPFDDGNACNGVVVCNGGICSVDSATVVACAAPEPGGCQAEVCDPDTGACELEDLPEGSGCDDGVSCTIGDACAAGICAGVEMPCDTHACGEGVCNEDTGVCQMVPLEDGATCGDDGSCSAGFCDGGACVPPATQCACVFDDDCLGYDDGDACTGLVACLGGRCQVDPSTFPACPAPDGPCEVAVCDSGTGVCDLQPAADGKACDDGDACSGPDTCASGACVPETPTCEVSDGCHVAECHPAAGCRIRPIGVACPGEGLCTQSAGCTGGQCVETSFVTCDASEQCQAAACDQADGECKESPVEGPCDDGDGCTVDDQCAAGACLGTAKVCDDGAPCTTDLCGASGACESVPNDGVLCDDGNACTLGDACSGPACVGVEGAACGCGEDADCDVLDDGDPCTGTLFCDAGTCRIDPGTIVVCIADEVQACASFACVPSTGACEWVPAADGLPCEDGDACTATSTCTDGACGGFAVTCDDGNPCTLGACDPGEGCVYTAKSGPCDDGNPCTAASQCTFGECKGPNTCDCDGDEDCAAEEDGDACNGTLICSSGKCNVDLATVVICEASGDPCVANTCNPATGQCSAEPQDGVTCADGDPCTSGDVCAGGTCMPGAPVDCDDGNPCTAGSCDPGTGACVYTGTGASCDDGNPCTDEDVCLGAECAGSSTCACAVDEDCDAQVADLCVGVPVCGLGGGCEILPDSGVECADPGDTPCAFKGCDPATGACVDVVLGEGEACDDDDPCAAETQCDAAGACVGTPVTCDDGSGCTADTCEVGVGCIFAPIDEGLPCDDDDVCTAGEICQAGVCGGGAFGCPCSVAAQCPSGPDLCTNSYECVGNLCVKQPAVDCSGATGLAACEVSICNPGTGECEEQDAGIGALCDDGGACTVNDHCAFGFCVGDPKNCDDGNGCTLDSCLGGECIHEAVADATSCNDGDTCTKGDKCQLGECVPGPDLCVCDDDSDCKTFDTDNNKCTGIWLCLESYCTDASEQTAITCPDSNPYDCLDPVCEPADGSCGLSPRAAGQSCNDGSGCTTSDVCGANGTCAGVVQKVCSDPNPDDCVTFVCSATSTDCLPMDLPDAAACDDGNDCTEADRCVAKSCQGLVIDCDDGNPCTADWCSAESGCGVTHLFGSCDDSNPCTSNTICKAGKCQAGTNLCAECFTDGECIGIDDDDQCNGELKCIDFVCQTEPGSVSDCPDDPAQPCMTATCDPASGFCGLEPLADYRPCDDLSPCSTDDHCEAGVCVGSPCDDDNPCTVDSCDGDTGNCLHTPAGAGTACDDGDGCNGADACNGISCQGGLEALCGCEVDADCVAFDDADACNGTLLCGALGQCEPNPASAVTCPTDPSGCTEWVCDPETGACLGEPVADPIPCNDGDPCTADDRCGLGACVGTPIDCNDKKACTLDECDLDGSCIHHAFVGPCDDNNPCTIEDVCDESGACFGKTKSCNDGKFCTNDSCIPDQGCKNQPKANGTGCQITDFCIVSEQCISGECTGTNVCACETDDDCQGAGDGDLCKGTYTCDDISGGCLIDPDTVPDCGQSTACLDVACEPETGACVETPINVGGNCNDGDDCTNGDACTAGGCVGEPVVCDETGDPCTERLCIDGEGCIVQDVIGSCDDGEGCTGEDHCVGGTCIGFNLNVGADAAFNFDEPGEPPASSTTGDEAGWRISGLYARSLPLSLVSVNPVTGTLDDPSGAWESTVTLPPVAIPDGTIFVSVTFHARLDLADDSCDAQVLDLLVGGQPVPSARKCASTGGAFLAVNKVIVPYTPGTDIEIGFRYQALASDPLGGAGVAVDDVFVDVVCPQ